MKWLHSRLLFLMLQIISVKVWPFIQRKKDVHRDVRVLLLRILVNSSHRCTGQIRSPSNCMTLKKLDHCHMTVTSISSLKNPWGVGAPLNSNYLLLLMYCLHPYYTLTNSNFDTNTICQVVRSTAVNSTQFQHIVLRSRGNACDRVWCEHNSTTEF